MAGKRLLLPSIAILWLSGGLPGQAMADPWDCRQGLMSDAWGGCAPSSIPPASAPKPAPVVESPGPAADDPRLEAGLDWGYCGPRPLELGPYPLEPLPAEDTLIELSADSADLPRRENRALLQGGVRADRGSQHLETDSLTYDRDRQRIEASGSLLLRQPGIRVLGARGELDLTSRQSWLYDARYRLEGHNARGSAQSAHLETSSLSHFQNITYTACPPGSQAWELRAERLDVDRDAGEGVARGAQLRLGGFPVLYSPYLSFPLDDRRKSGFLTPSIGSSDKLGLDIRAPYYLNLAPDMDATLVPRLMTKRGLMLGGEFRYLTSQQSGEIYGEIVPDDQDAGERGARGGLSVNQRGSFGGRWASNVLINWVSDDRYLEDFGSDLNVTSNRNLERRGDLYYFGDRFQALARVQDFQTVDRTIAAADRPYSRLPQLWLSYGQDLWQGVGLGLEAENVYFHHEDNVRGNRLAFRPNLSMPLRASYGHLTPQVSLQHASYWLTDQKAGLSDSPAYTIPSFNLDGGLVFERAGDWLGESITQTLEPRLFYLYTPYHDQSDLPVFDSAELDFNFDSLFRANRFTGRDRIGDANQVTLALTSRTFSERSGHELFRASIGQVLYFADRKVQLEGVDEQDNASELAGELAARLGDRWTTRASLMWDPNRADEQFRKTSLALRYRTPERQLFNLAYRINRSDTEEDSQFDDLDSSFRWPLGGQVDLVGRWLYSNRYDKTMDAFAGLEYGHCCWRLRALARNYVSSPEDDSNFSLMLQLELAGLGSFGNRVNEFLQEGIHGYEIQ